MNEITIYSQIEEVVEKIKNKKDIQDVIEDIQDVVTKEQFKNCMYKVGD